MSRKAAAYVHVAGQVFAPGDEVPDAIAKKITNPAAWGDEAAKDKAKEREQEFDPNTPPPRAGKGSSKDAWQRFAAGHGVQLENDATRDDYIAVLQERGIVQPEE
jgi:hypothetical protein